VSDITPALPRPSPMLRPSLSLPVVLWVPFRVPTVNGLTWFIPAGPLP